MNDRSKTASPKPGVLAKHDTLQTVQAPKTGVLAESIKRGLHPVFPRKSNARPTSESGKRGFRAKKATIKRG